MPAYMIANVRFRDMTKAQEYGTQVGPIVTQFGGKYLVRRGHAEVAEGDWQFAVVTIVEFPSMEDAKKWYDSEAYQPLRALRSENAESQIIFVESLAMP